MTNAATPGGRLFVVATPIGNLEDITHRAVRILAEADRIAAEDTRHTRRLLAHYGIETPLTSYHEHNERDKAETLLEALQRGEQIALVTDAGTPCISDPGYRLVQAAHEAGIPVSPVPGACAAVAALSASGLPTDSFTFHGFFPRKAGAAQALLDAVKEQPGTHVFYEAPRRAAATVACIAESLPDAPAVIARELTKVHETITRGTAAALAQRADILPDRGEYVVLVHVKPADSPPPSEDALRKAVDEAMEEEGLSRRDAIRAVAKTHGVPRNLVYAAARGEDSP